jgi:hypothetical protein
VSIAGSWAISLPIKHTPSDTEKAEKLDLQSGRSDRLMSLAWGAARQVRHSVVDIGVALPAKIASGIQAEQWRVVIAFADGLFPQDWYPLFPLDYPSTTERNVRGAGARDPGRQAGIYSRC